MVSSYTLNYNTKSPHKSQQRGEEQRKPDSQNDAQDELIIRPIHENNISSMINAVNDVIEVTDMPRRIKLAHACHRPSKPATIKH